MDFSANKTSGNAPLLVSFTPTTTGTVTSLEWNFGDPAIPKATSSNAAVTYATPGTYTVSLTVTGPDGSVTEIKSNLITVMGGDSGGGADSGSDGTDPDSGVTNGTDELVAAYAFDDGRGVIASDSSGNGNDGRINGAAWAGGTLNGALDFDGVDDYVDAGRLDVAGDMMTITGWINADRFDHLNDRAVRIVSKATGISEQSHYWMLSTIKSGANTRLRFRLKTNGRTSTLIASPAGVLRTGTWIHVAAVYDGGQMRFYQDGIQVGSIAKTGLIDQGIGVAAWIGRNPSGSRPFDGLLDDVGIYNIALTKAGIQALASGGP